MLSKSILVISRGAEVGYIVDRITKYINEFTYRLLWISIIEYLVRNMVLWYYIWQREVEEVGERSRGINRRIMRTRI